jgi:hypothetical protein
MNRVLSTDSFGGYRQYSYSESFLDSIALRDPSGNVIGIPIGINLHNQETAIVEPLPRPASPQLPTTAFNRTPEPNRFWASGLLHSLREQLFRVSNRDFWFCHDSCQRQNFNSYARSLFQHVLLYMIHIGLISLFEIYFFFHVISFYEDTALVSLINSYITAFIDSCSHLPVDERDILSLLFHTLVNQTVISDNAIIAYDKRISWNDALYSTAWSYFAVILIINIALIFINYYYRVGIKMWKLFLDNTMMIVFLGIYEYLFFQTIILRYQSISSDELTANVVRQINSCLPSQGWNISFIEE